MPVTFVHPRLAFFIADEKDLAGCVTGMFHGSNCQRPCNMCITSFQDQSLVHVGTPRSLSFMRNVSLFNFYIAMFWL